MLTRDNSSKFWGKVHVYTHQVLCMIMQIQLWHYTYVIVNYKPFNDLFIYAKLVSQARHKQTFFQSNLSDIQTKKMTTWDSGLVVRCMRSNFNPVGPFTLYITTVLTTQKQITLSGPLVNKNFFPDPWISQHIAWEAGNVFYFPNYM